MDKTTINEMACREKILQALYVEPPKMNKLHC